MGHWGVARFRSCVKTLPPSGRCPSAHTGADEEWRYLSFSNAVRKNGCNRKIIAILTGCSQRCNLSPFLIRLAFGDPPMNYGVIATGNDYYFDSLRGAPPPGEGFGRSRASAINANLFYWQSLCMPVTENSTHSAMLVQWSPMRSKYLAIIRRSRAYSPSSGFAAMMPIMAFFTSQK